MAEILPFKPTEKPSIAPAAATQGTPSALTREDGVLILEIHENLGRLLRRAGNKTLAEAHLRTAKEAVGWAVIAVFDELHEGSGHD